MKSKAVSELPARSGFIFFGLFGKGGGGGSAAILKSTSSLIAALKGIQTNIFFADPQFTLIFTNRKAMESLRRT